MNVRKVRRLCMVKGCGNRDSYSLSVSSEFGQSVIICGDCLKSAKEAVTNLKNGVKVYKEETVKTEAPSLFFHPTQAKTVEKIVEEPKVEEVSEIIEKEEEKPIIEEAKTDTEEDFVCPKCGKRYKSQSAFERHILVCKG